MTSDFKDIYVYNDWCELPQPMLLGVLHSEIVRGKEVFSFSCSDEWLKNKELRLLDPDLGQFSGPQYLRDEKPNFGLFLDSSPDRWGRLLMKRREEIKARSEYRRSNTLHESDFLLGVFDQSRMGALRFKLDPEGDFLDNDPHFATPPFTSLRELEYATQQFEQNQLGEASDYAHWLRMIYAPGSSLGGARPKANVVDKNGHLWIAKFPSKNDDYDIGAWEMVAYSLAKKCGIAMADSRIERYSSRFHTFLTKRFDRTDSNGRGYFASAMTLLGHYEGDITIESASYLEMVEFITRYGTDVNANLEQLWRRLVFNIAISNCDDHLRNHGFILTKNGWTLSPAYDINPSADGVGLSLNIDGANNSLDFSLAISVAPYFRLSPPKANAVLEEVRHAVAEWRKVATSMGISHSEQERMANAFRF